MKYAVISDIHSNHIALEAVLEEIADKQIERVICLGDLVGYHTYPNEVIDLLIKFKVNCIMGNHDLKYLNDEVPKSIIGKYMKNVISAENREYISRLPLSHSFDLGDYKILCVHGSPNDISEYMYEGEINTEEIMKVLESDVLISGHTHYPVIKQFGSKYYMNPGSIGKPKIGRIESSYLIIELRDGILNMSIHYTAYDNAEIVKGLRENNFPTEIIESALRGK